MANYKFTEAAASVMRKARELAVKNKNSVIGSLHIESALYELYNNIFVEELGERTFKNAKADLQDDLRYQAGRTVPKAVSLSPLVAEGFEAVNEASKLITLGKLYSVVAVDLHNEESDREPPIEGIKKIILRLEEADKDSPFHRCSMPGFDGEMPQAVDWHDFVCDMLEAAKKDDKPLIGRDSEVEDTIRILLRHDKCNPVHVGEPGVGKTAITRGLAKRIVSGDVPEKLKNAELFSVDLAGMVAGTQYRGQFEERLKALIKGVKEECNNPILFFDEIHTIVGAGACSSGAMDASNILKPELAEGVIKFIGATTLAEYRTCIEKDKALERRFQKVMVDEPSVEDCKKIIKGIAPAYENHHNVKYTDEAISAAVDLSKKYINDRFLPDKAIDLIDEAGATRAAHPTKSKKITARDIETVLEKTCHIPHITNEEEDFAKIRNLDESLTKKVFGQNEAIKSVADAIKLSKSGLTDGEKPIASFLFVGPSGVGKTELTKQLAQEMNIPLIRFDMSEYQEAHSVAKLTGAPAGYIGYEDGGVLTEAIRKTPHCVVLFDEIEKAHPDIYKVFLQMMDYGMLTDSKGRKADFRNTVIIMTSNAGATVVNKSAGIGFNKLAENAVNIEGIMDAVNQTFTPEFRNRLTKIIIFNKLNPETAKLVVKKELKGLSDKLKLKKIKTSFSDEVINSLVELGTSDTYGARGVQRTIDEKIKKLFVEAIINGDNLSNCSVEFENGEFKIKT